MKYQIIGIDLKTVEPVPNVDPAIQTAEATKHLYKNGNVGKRYALITSIPYSTGDNFIIADDNDVEIETAFLDSDALYSQYARLKKKGDEHPEGMIGLNLITNKCISIVDVPEFYWVDEKTGKRRTKLDPRTKQPVEMPSFKKMRIVCKADENGNPTIDVDAEAMRRIYTFGELAIGGSAAFTASPSAAQAIAMAEAQNAAATPAPTAGTPPPASAPAPTLQP